MKWHLNFLAFNTNSPNSALSGGVLPSWAPDWSLGDSRPSSIWKPGLYHAANKNEQPRIVPLVAPSSDSDVLGVAGCIIVQIAAVTDILTLDETWNDPGSESLRNTIQEIEALVCSFYRARIKDTVSASNMCKSILDPNQSDMLWRTLTADRERPHFNFSTPAPPQFKATFEALRKGLRVSGDVDLDATSEPPSFSADHEHYSPEIGSQLDSTGRMLHREEDSESSTSLQAAQETDVKQDISEARWLRAQYIAMMRLTLQHRRVFMTEYGHLGVVSRGVQAGDIVALLIGADVPIIIRSREKGHPLQLISEAYVHGLMYGEVLHEKPILAFIPIQ
ncbi:MAG: hypothetical protein M1821_007733 [Bathelium mastoideum]|nr:MAG: hypothetical protein M1821_007733 [Bathelium mastoideum]